MVKTTAVEAHYRFSNIDERLRFEEDGVDKYAIVQCLLAIVRVVKCNSYNLKWCSIPAKSGYICT